MSYLPGFLLSGKPGSVQLTRDKKALAEILTRFVGQSENQKGVLHDIEARLKKSRTDILAKQGTLDELNDALSALPSLKVQLQQFEDTDLVGKLSEKTAMQDEARVFTAIELRVSELKDLASDLKPTDSDKTKLLPSEEDSELLNHTILSPLEVVLAEIIAARDATATALRLAADKADGGLQAVQKTWKPLSEAAEKRYDDLIEELKAEGHEPERFVAIKKQVDDLKPKEAEKVEILVEIEALQTARQAIIDEWEKADRAAFQELARAAKRVSKRLKSSVRASVKPGSDLTPLKGIFARHTDGSNGAALSRLEDVENLSMSELARNIRKGAASLMDIYSFTENGAAKIATAGDKLALEIEEGRLPAQAIIELNVGNDTADNWKKLDHLSAGQRATAVLMLLLLEADAPLIVDQPEDDLDNQFIVQHVVETMRVAKETRQFLFSSHNPNIPVLGDAEQIVGLTPTVEGGIDQTVIDERLSGAIDTPAVKELIKLQLEGGEQAFRTRERKYGF